jgi:hypothetical protein
MQVKGHFTQSISTLLKTPTSGGMEDSCVDVARKQILCALQKQTETGPERSALLALQDCTEAWASADRLMIIGDQLDGHSALVELQKSRSKSRQAALLCPTEGYYGAKIEFGFDVNRLLAACIESAIEEIKRRQNYEIAVESGKRRLQERKTEPSLIALQLADNFAKHELEWATVRDLQSQADEEFRRQKYVKDLFSKAETALQANDTDCAIQW